MIHVVFNEPDVAVIRQAIELDPSLNGEIMLIRDDYAVGPLAGLDGEEGQAARKAWWSMVLEGGDYSGSVDQNLVDDERELRSIKEALNSNENEFLWIWVAQNKHDVCGYFWLVSRLSEFQGRIHILYLNNLPFISEKGNLFYPEWLSQIPPKEFIKAKKLARPVTTSEFEVDADEWSRLSQEGMMVRLLEGGKKLIQREVDHYDEDLKKYITSEPQKAAKVINTFLSKNKQTTGDAFLLWRLKSMAQSQSFEVTGELKGMKDFDIKKRSEVAQEA